MGLWKPKQIGQTEQDSPKFNVWCEFLHDIVTGPFFFVEKIVNGNVYQSLLELCIILQSECLHANVLF